MGEPTPACLTDDQLAQLVDGRVGGAQLEQLESHLDTCDHCRGVLAVVSNGSAPAMRAERAVLQPGHRLGRYQVERLIAAGGMGVLYVALDEQLGRRVALKLMRPSIAADGGKVRLLREAQAMAQLSHPNVVNVYELGEVDGRVFVAMELVEGGTLRDWMKGAHSWKETVEMFCAAGEGLAAAHRTGVVHRDFKPENVLVGAKDSRPRVGDFGLARPELGGDRPAPLSLPLKVTHTGSMLGTPAYMSPEQLAGKTADARSDQYGFCVCLFEALAGQRPFPADTLEDLRARVSGGMPTPPRDGLIPAHVWAALARGLNPDPAERFPDMEALLTVLRFAAPPSEARSPPRWGRRVLAAGVGVALVGAGALVLVGAPPPEPAMADPAAEAKRSLQRLPDSVELEVGDRHHLVVRGPSQAVAADPTIIAVDSSNVDALVLTAATPGRTVLTVTVAPPGQNTVGAASKAIAVTVVPSSRDEALKVAVNQSVSLGRSDVQRIALDDPRIAKVVTAGEKVVVTGLVPGTTKMFVWTHDAKRHPYTIVVSAPVAAAKRPVAARPVAPEEEELEPVAFADLAAAAEAPQPRVAVDGDPLPSELTLGVSTSRVFAAPGLSRVAVGDSSVLDVKAIRDGQLIVMGRAEGRASLLLWGAEPKPKKVLVTVAARPQLVATDIALSLEASEQTVLTFAGITRVSVTDPKVLEVKPLPHGELLLVGLAEGLTDLVVWPTGEKLRHYFVTVQPSPRDAAPKEPGVSVKVGDVTVLDEPGLMRVAVGDPKVLEVRSVGAGKLELLGKAAGVTSLLLWNESSTRKSLRVSVTP